MLRANLKRLVAQTFYFFNLSVLGAFPKKAGKLLFGTAFFSRDPAIRAWIIPDSSISCSTAQGPWDSLGLGASSEPSEATTFRPEGRENFFRD